MNNSNLHLTDEQIKALEKNFLRDGEFNFLNLKALSVALIKNGLKENEDFLKTDEGKIWSLCYTETDKLEQNKGMVDSSESSPAKSPFDFTDNTQYITNYVTDENILGF
jgi:hypothetical protein